MRRLGVWSAVFLLCFAVMGAWIYLGSNLPVARAQSGASKTPPAAMQTGTKKPAAPAKSATPEIHGFDTNNLDRTCKPCQDFYQFATGGWRKANPIPAAYPNWGTFSILAERNREAMHTILEDAAKQTSAAPGSNLQKIGDLYASCMNTTQIEADGSKPLDPEFERIAAIHDAAGLQAEVARLHSLNVNVMFGFGAEQDFKDSTKVIGTIGQSGLGMPDRDYYLKDDDRSKQTREAYQKHVTAMFALLGDPPERAAAETQTVMGIETDLAKASLTRVQRRDPNAIYHKMTLAELKTLAPDFEWSAYFQAVGSPVLADLNVAEPEFFKALDAELGKISLDDWKTYFRWHLINAAAPALSDKFVNEDFDFKGKTLSGAKELLPRWQRCTQSVDRHLGEALGQIYVKKNFPPAAKAHALEMVNNLIAALHDDLTTLPWMSDATRKQAIAKLEAFTKKIGYPDKWRDYSKLKVDRGPFITNVFRSNEFDNLWDLGKIGKPVDRTEWGMTPPTVNAYYNPLMNEVVFPAGILQPPFFDPKADDAINYGGIGAAIGHEMTHGFDDQGSQFDADGNLKNWWTPDDLKSFKARAECVQKQFDGFVVQGDLHENGKLVEGESIADLGGLTIAYAAFEHSLKGKPRPKNIGGFTPEQRFFLAWAQVWQANQRPEYERLMINTNPHPLPQFRVVGPISNMPAFMKAFHCVAGDPMVRPEGERCQIW